MLSELQGDAFGVAPHGALVVGCAAICRLGCCTMARCGKAQAADECNRRPQALIHIHFFLKNERFMGGYQERLLLTAGRPSPLLLTIKMGSLAQPLQAGVKLLKPTQVL